MKTTYRPSALHQFLDDRLEPLLELPPVLRPGQQLADVQRHQLVVLQGVGDVAVDDPLGQSLDDGGLAHAGLADQHGIVLGPARQHLHDPPDFLVPPDHRVEFAAAGLHR